LSDEDRAAVDGIPCTTWARTLLDIAPLIDDRALEKAVERAEILELYDHRAIVSLLARAEGQPGTRRLANAVGIARPGQTVTNSPLEELMLALCRDWGLPEPEVNAEILLGGERAQVDFLWRAQRVVVEIDGFRYHRGRAAFRRDRRRDRLLELAGYGHARFADEEFDADRLEIRGTLVRLLDRSSRG
jgi:very-short-patch-repair endonuclease